MNAHNRSGTTGGSKGKGKRNKVVKTNANTSASSNNKSSRQDRNSNKRDGHISNNNSSRWMNGDDNKPTKNFKANSKNRGKKGQYLDDNDDNRPADQNSIPSTTNTSYNNSARKAMKNEEIKDNHSISNKNGYNLSHNFGSNGVHDVSSNNNRHEASSLYKSSEPYLLREDKDEFKYTFESAKQHYSPSPYEMKQIYSLGIDLNDN